jgi:hypothetical protein
MKVSDDALEVMPHGFLTLELAAKQFGMSVAAVRMLMYRNPLVIRKYRTGNQLLVREADIEKTGRKRLVEA